jgi:hypothetical protein
MIFVHTPPVLRVLPIPPPLLYLRNYSHKYQKTVRNAKFLVTKFSPLLCQFICLSTKYTPQDFVRNVFVPSALRTSNLKENIKLSWGIRLSGMMCRVNGQFVTDVSGPHSCSETSAINYPLTTRNIAEDQRPRLHRDESLKSHKKWSHFRTDTVHNPLYCQWTLPNTWTKYRPVIQTTRRLYSESICIP